MPKDTLESFCYEGFYESSELHRAKLASFLSNHFLSLKEIHLWNCYSVCGFSVTQLLHFAPALESLVIENGIPGILYNVGLELQHLSNVSWASSRFRKLQLVVDIGHLSYLPPNNFHQAFSLPRLHQDVAATSFGGLMANIGKQKDLRVLDLKVALPRHFFHRDGRPWVYQDESFPGMLTLNRRAGNDPENQDGRLRRGFLDMLAGLSKLEELRGSVSLNSRDDQGYSTGREEAEWMKMHWPRLKIAEFYPAVGGHVANDPDDEFLWLQKALPGLIYSDDHSA
ncbi:hypothetical protein BG015_007698 [Linnemannia schmuckeri]|uniref:Uncharacterized protein n=1 Tax=Linnemannia schmuckeri TaxID=64567 RepID=A0A9P5S0B9_9FUNG|nr:hypothetical protein BG015_007698 [Linnemannia schmuckeri]